MNPSLANDLSVLFVDDQPLLLKMLQAVVEVRAPEWKLRFANNGTEALSILEQDEIEVVVSDMNMPGMDGVSLLHNVRKLHPQLLRFILSGQSEKSGIMSAVGVAHQMLNKPVRVEDLYETMEFSRTLYSKIKDPSLQEMLAGVQGLPTPSELYFKIGKLLEDPNADLQDVAELVSSDVAISARVLQLVNSAMFYRSQRVESVYDAVTTLGVEMVRSIVLIAGISEEQSPAIRKHMDLNRFAQQSLSTAKISRLLAKQYGLKAVDQEALFTAGLLHDIGKLVLLNHHLDTYQQQLLVEDPFDREMQVEQLEKETHSHGLVGAALLALWGIPARIINAIAWHDHPELDPGPSEFASIVHLAEALVCFEQKSDGNGDFWQSGLVDAELGKNKGFSDIIEAYLADREASFAL